jgi:DNA polymerase-3 subunit epsilon
MKKRQIILDTETTGLDFKEGHRIIEIGCIEMVNRRLTGKAFHRYINPEHTIEPGAQEVHGIMNDFLKDKPLFAGVVDEFIRFIDGSELIIHNAPFDIGFINHEFRLLKRGLGKIEDSCSIIDTLTMARRLHPGQKNNLDILCKRYGVNNSHREWHGALLDAELLAQVYLAMTSGQDNLFSMENESKTQQQSQTENIIRSYDIPVLRANAEELDAHNHYF